MTDNSANNGKRVCVTGASGYIGAHVVRQLLRAGHRVRATVRDPGDENKTAHLRAMTQESESQGELELVGADLMRAGSFDQAVAGCEWVCHAASPVQLMARDPQREIVDVAVTGTENVLQSVRRAGTVRRVVITSSIAAVAGVPTPDDHLFTEADWNESASLADPYPLSKTLAERRAWEIQRGLPEEERFELVTINPSYVLGPLLARVHARSSPSLVRSIMRGNPPGCPRIFLNIVDGRDVALAHLRALERPGASGRYIACNRGLWIREMARTLAPSFPGHPIRTRGLPDMLVYVGALFDKRLTWSWLRRNLGRRIRFDGTRLQRELGLEYRPLEQTLLDTARSMVEHNLVRPR